MALDELRQGLYAGKNILHIFIALDFNAVVFFYEYHHFQAIDALARFCVVPMVRSLGVVRAAFSFSISSCKENVV